MYGSAPWPSVKEVARRFQAHHSTVAGVLARRGVPIRQGRPAPPLDEAEVLRLEAEGLSQSAIAEKLGTTQVRVSRVLRKNGVFRGLHRQGPTHSSFASGRRMERGYVLVLLDPADPMFVMADRSGYVREHRLVVARSLGRPLDRSETVHHINGRTDDNRLENLQLRQGQHGNGVRFRCCTCGSENVEAVALV